MAGTRRKILSGFAGVVIAAQAATIAVAQPTTQERFAVIANGETVGHVYADLNGPEVNIDYAISENGRGPKHKEHIVLAPSGAPVEWTIQGTSLMGGPVSESLTWKDGIERWTSQADSGEVKTSKPLLYVADDASEWALGLYAQALAKTPGGALAVLPGGNLKLEKIRAVTVGQGTSAVTLDAYLLSGVELTPQLLLMDQQGRLFAQLDDTVTVREDHAQDYAALKTLGRTLTLEILEHIQAETAHSYDAPIRIRNVRLFDPQTLQLTPPKSVVVFRGKITTVEPLEADKDPYPDEVLIDGQGGTIVSGLHDMHSHNSLWSGPFYLAAGVTTVRDMGNDNGALLDLTKRLDAGDLPGPHIISSGFLEGRSPYSARNGFIPQTLDEGLHDVHWYADRGYIQIKIYNSMTPEWVKPLSTEASGLGLRTVGHVPAFTTPDHMIESGYNEITHINQLMLGWLLKPGEDTRTPLRLTGLSRAVDLDLNSAPVRHTIDLMKAHDTGLDTTAVIVERLMLSRAGQVAAGDRAYLDHMPIGYQRYRKRSFVNFKDDAEKTRYDAAFAKVMQTLALLHHEGVRLWPGTDDATGFTVHRELELYTRLGMTPAEVLKTATYDCDQYLGRDQQYGSIQRGKQADFFLIPGDPTKDINAIRQIRMVMKGGVIYFPSELYQALGVKPFATPLPLTPAKNQVTPVATAAASAFSLTRNAFGQTGGDDGPE